MSTIEIKPKKTIIPQAPVITGTGINPASPYEIQTINGVDYLSLENKTDFSVSGGRSVGDADSENGWEWQNRANLSTADENTSTSNAVSMTIAAGSAYVWNNTTTDAPARVKKYEPSNQIQHWYAFLGTDATADANVEIVNLLLYEDTAPTNMCRIGVGYAGAADNRLSYRIGTTSGNTAITADQKGGMWVRISRWRRDIWASYNVSTDSSTIPTSWTVAASVASELSGDSVDVWVGQLIQNGSGADDVTGFVEKFIDEDAFPDSKNMTTPKWQSVQYDATNPEIQILDDWDLGDDSVVLDQTAIRNIMTDVVNTISGDSSAWTFYLVQSTTVGASSGSYEAAGSITVNGTGRYVSMFAKSNASTGEEAGHLRLPIILPFVSA